MLIGYARTSTVEQLAGLEAQLRLLKEVGCERVEPEAEANACWQLHTQLIGTPRAAHPIGDRSEARLPHSAVASEADQDHFKEAAPEAGPGGTARRPSASKRSNSLRKASFFEVPPRS